MTVDLDLCYAPATEIAARIRSRELSPVDVVANALARIEAVGEQLNCFCFVFAEEALAEARQAERALMSGAALGPLHGVPVAFKDLTPMAGRISTMGSHAFRDHRPERSALLVEKIVGAGAIVVATTTTPEFAHSGFTSSPLWGHTRNPWDLERSPGGSSGGSGAAVAGGCVPLAEGTDMGGSVRIPASWTGVVGLKPSFGRIPLDFLPTQFDAIQHFGPLARTIEDARLFVAIGQGPDDRDIMSITTPLDLSGAVERDGRGLRLALDMDLGCYAVDPEVEENVRAAADALVAAGAVVEEIDLGWTREPADAWFAHWGVYLAAIFGDALAEQRERLDPGVVALMDAGLAMNAVDFKRLEFARTDLWRSLAPVFERYDALLCPTMAQPARPIGEDDSLWTGDDDQGRYLGLDMTTQFNWLSPCPALSVPAGWTRAGLPVGLQVVAARHRDDVALRIGAVLELERPWAQRRPAL
jgi:Asp-tRNA(Asn)/Glu-tRNA(Gln) amidotransferase A subunit family amidase